MLLVIVTVAPGTAAPCSSVAFTRMLPDCTCADAITASRKMCARANARLRFMLSLLKAKTNQALGRENERTRANLTGASPRFQGARRALAQGNWAETRGELVVDVMRALRQWQTRHRHAAAAQLEQLEKLHARALLLLERAEHGAGDRVGVL